MTHLGGTMFAVSGSDGLGWNPWQTLRALDHIELSICALPDGYDGVACPYPGRPVILLDSRLDQVQRNATLAHELIHLERGGACGAARHEERIVEDEVARRLVPRSDLERFVAHCEQLQEPVVVWQVADAWGVPEPVALRALELLRAWVPPARLPETSSTV